MEQLYTCLLYTSTVEDILTYAPQNPWLAAGFLLLLSAAKSLSIAFPIIIIPVSYTHLDVYKRQAV